MAELKPWPFSDGPETVDLDSLAQFLEDRRGFSLDGGDAAHSREALLALLDGEGYDVPGFVVQGPEPEDQPVLPPAWQGYREWPFDEGIGSVDLAELHGFLVTRGVQVTEADAASRRALLDLLAREGFAAPGYVPGEELAGERREQNRAEQAHRTAVEEALGGRQDPALEETMQRRDPDYQDPVGDDGGYEYPVEEPPPLPGPDAPEPGGQILRPWPFGTRGPDQVSLDGLREFLDSHDIVFRAWDDRPALLGRLARAGYHAAPEPGDGHAWPFRAGPQFVPLGSVRVWLARQGGPAEDVAEQLAQRHPEDRSAHLAALREFGAAFPDGPPAPYRAWPFLHGPHQVPLETIRSWLAAESSFWAGRADGLPASDRARHLAALAEAGVEFPRELPDLDGPDLPEFSRTLMEATGEQLDEALDEIGPDGRARLLRALSRMPVTARDAEALWLEEEPQWIVPGYQPGEHEPLRPFVMGRASSGKSSYAALAAAEYAAEVARQGRLAGLNGPDTADWIVEIVTRHRFHGITAERASVEAVGEARSGGGEVREVLTRREKPGEAVMTSFSDAYTDLSWLADNGALDGVAEVLRERRRQIEECGYTREHDGQHADGFLVSEADSHTTAAIVTTAQGLSGPAEVERHMAMAGALAAAEIDRLQELV